jgi:rRNA-processing protein FCF1
VIRDATGVRADLTPMRYAGLVDASEPVLRNTFPDPAVADGLLTERYWYIQMYTKGALPSGSSNFVINAEINWQIERLTRIRAALETLRQLAGRGGHLIVLDANVYLHCQPFHQINWNREMRLGEVRIVLPLVILDELDKVKYMKGDRADRAASVAKVLDGFLPDMERQGYAEVRKGVTIEIVTEEPGHRRHENRDTETIHTAVVLKQATQLPLTVVTNDRGMRVRAHVRGLTVWPVPDHLQLK